MSEYVSRDIHLCECGRMVAWVISPRRIKLPYEIKGEITTMPDGTRAVTVSSYDFHYCARYPRLAKFIGKASDKNRKGEVRICLPNKRKGTYTLTHESGNNWAHVTNGKTGRNYRKYGSLSLKTGGYRVQYRSSILSDLLDLIDQNPFKFDWSLKRTQTDCCFCGRPLNDHRSVRWGYGPTCAQNYGMPWW